MNKRYQVVYDTEHFTGDTGFFDNLKEALSVATDILVNWMNDERSSWEFKNKIPKPTKKQIEDWNYMINTCEVYVADLEYDGSDPEETETESYYCIDGHYYPALETVENLGWKYWE